MRRRRDDVLVGRHLGGLLNGHVGLAFVVEHEELVLVFRFCIGVAQPHREIGGVAAAQSVHGNPARERTDEPDLDRLLGLCAQGRRGEQHARDDEASPMPFAHCLPPLCTGRS